MEESLTPYDRLDTYLERLEAQERARRQRVIILLVILLVVGGGGGYFLYQYFLPKESSEIEIASTFRRFAAEELNPEKVQKLFVSDPNPLVVIHPVTGVDTIQSMDDYYQFLNRLDLIEMETDVEPQESLAQQDDEQDDEQEEEEQALPAFKVNMEGDKQVGKRLTYIIENYDPSFEIILDFGNGITRRARRSTSTYTYPLPGHFDFHLKVVSNGEEEIIQTLKYQIFPRESASVNREDEQTANEPTS